MAIQESRVRLSSGLIRVTFANIGISIVIWNLSPGKRAIVRKIMWYNNTGGAGILSIGYLNLTPAFVQALPQIRMVNATHDFMSEDELPIFGNMPQGFMADTTAVTGSLGNIVIQSSVGGAPGVDAQIELEIEEI